ncbi:MAG: FmdB family zinc ribbon protein [Bacteroidota bacterium]
MPTYDYKCSDCGHTFEELQSMKEAALVLCPKCGKETLVRLIGGGGGMIFKGSGFYLTDYKSGSSGKGSSAVSPSTPKAESKPAPSTRSSSKE